MATAKDWKLDETYDAIKAIEANFPVPTPTMEIMVGTYNTLTNFFTFDGAWREYTVYGPRQVINPAETVEDRPDKEVKGQKPKPPERVITPDWPGADRVKDTAETKPVIVTPIIEQGHETTVNAVNVQLVFTVSGGQPCWIEFGTMKYDAYKDQIILYVEHPFKIELTIRTQRFTSKYKLKINRPEFIGMGAFMVPLLPVGLIYEPPQTALKSNTMTYSESAETGTTISASFTQEQSTSQPVDAGFAGLNETKEVLSVVAQIASFITAKVTLPVIGDVVLGKAIGAVADWLATKALGEVNKNQTSGEKVTTDKRQTLIRTFSEKTTTGECLGPGLGDIIFCVQNARVMWVAKDMKCYLTLIGFDSTWQATMKSLKDALAQPEASLKPAILGRAPMHISRSSVEALLSLDPFAGNQNFDPSTDFSGRFVCVRKIEVWGGQTSEPLSERYTVEESDLNCRIKFETEILEMSKGFLSFLGIGIQEDKTERRSIELGNAKEVFSKHETEIKVSLKLEPGEKLALEIYYDTIFNTYVLYQVPPLTISLLSGSAFNQQGVPLTNQVVELVATDGKKHRTRTDKQGQFAFRAAAIKPGRLIIQTGAGAQLAQQPIDFTGTPIGNISLKSGVSTLEESKLPNKSTIKRPDLKITEPMSSAEEEKLTIKRPDLKIKGDPLV